MSLRGPDCARMLIRATKWRHMTKYDGTGGLDEGKAASSSAAGEQSDDLAVNRGGWDRISLRIGSGSFGA